MNDQFHIININKIIKRSSKSINLNIIKEDNNTNNPNFFKKVNVSKKYVQRDSYKKRLDIDESFTRGGGKNNDDINNRINSFLDFSMLNNKEDEKFGTMKASVWDLSAINDDKKD